MGLSKASLKRSFLIGILGSLVSSALVGIFILLKGNSDETDGRILATTLVIGVFSITSLASLPSLESKEVRSRIFSWIGVLVSASAFISFAVVIWGDHLFATEDLLRTAFSLAVLAVSWAHAALLLPLRHRSSTLYSLVRSTLGFIAVVAGMLIYLILGSNLYIEDFYYRLLGVFAILDVLGTIVLPIFARFTSKPDRL